MNFVRCLFAEVAQSAKCLKNTRNLTGCSMLLALGVVLDFFASFYVTPTLKVSTSFLAIAAIGYLYGVLPAVLCGGLLDVVMWLIKPQGAYFPGYTLSGALAGLIFALFLYNRSGKSLFFCAAGAKLTVNLLVNFLLNTYWTSLFVGKAFWLLLPPRIFKNIVLWPAESAVLILLLLFLAKNRGRLIKQ